MGKPEEIEFADSNIEEQRSTRTLLRSARIALLAAAILPEVANAECTSLTKGAIAIDIQSCGSVNPDAFDTQKDKFRFIADLDAQGKTVFLNQYRGLAVKGTIVRSKAISDGLDNKTGILQGENVLVYLPPGVSQCTELMNKRVSGNLQEKCCDGNGDAPCLLGTGLILTSPKVIGVSTVGADGKVSGSTTNRTHGKDYKEAEKYYAKKDFKKAVASFKKANDGGDIDIKGLYRWGNSLRELEDCASAVVPLERVYKLVQSGKSWKDEELDSRRATFLLARCHAKLGEASQAMFYLNGFLLEPKKYQSELKQSLKHKDFGWIHTSKEYVEYKLEAEKKINQK